MPDDDALLTSNIQPPTSPSVPHQCSSVDKLPKRRGGRRPGAGAPRGNLNALKHGRRSKQFATIGAVLASSPANIDALLALARRKQTHHNRAEDVAADLLVRLFNHARDVAHGKTSPGPFADIARLNVVRKALSDAQSTKSTKPTKKKRKTPSPQSNTARTTRSQIQNHP